MATFVYEETQALPPPMRLDGWANIKTGLGTSRDKRSYMSFGGSGAAYYTKDDFIAMYLGDGLVKRIVDMVPEDMTRQWGHFDGDPKDEYEDGLLSFHMNRLQAPDKFKQAKKWARLTGGALLYIQVVGAGNPKTPLKGQIPSSANIESLKVFDLGDIMTSEFTWEMNPSSPDFGKVKLYKVRVRVGDQVTYQELHASRCIPFFGEPLPPSTKEVASIIEARYWGVSMLRFLFDDLADFRAAFGHTSTILNEFIIGKYKFSDLDEMLAIDNGTRLKTRMEAIDLTKSTIKSVMLGTDEDYQRDTAALGGLSDILDRFMMLVSSSTGIPVTKLFGRSAAGMNSTGEGDMVNYYDMVRSSQNELSMYLEQFGHILADWLGVEESTNLTWEWNPLQQQTKEQEQNAERIEAETLRTKADALARMVDAMVLSPEEVRVLLFGEELAEMEETEGEMPPEPLDSPINKETTLKPEPVPVVMGPNAAANPNKNGGTPRKAKGIDKNSKSGGPNGTFTA